MQYDSLPEGNVVTLLVIQPAEETDIVVSVRRLSTCLLIIFQYK